MVRTIYKKIGKTFFCYIKIDCIILFIVYVELYTVQKSLNCIRSMAQKYITYNVCYTFTIHVKHTHKSFPRFQVSAHSVEFRFFSCGCNNLNFKQRFEVNPY